MNKSYKPKDGNYIDSTGIVHNREILKNILPIGKAIWNLNLNDLPNIYKYGLFAGLNCTNAPSNYSSNANHWYIIQLTYENLAIQFATPMFEGYTESSKLYMRRKSTTSWSSWSNI